MKKLVILFLFIPSLSMAANGLEVTDLAWDYPTTVVSGGPLLDSIAGAGVYCRAEGEQMPLIPIDIPAPQTSIALGSINLPDGNVFCAVDVYVRILPTTDPIRSEVTSEILFFVGAGIFYTQNPADHVPNSPLNLRVE